MATESTSGFASGNPSNLHDKVSAAAHEAKSRATDLGRKVSDTADQVRANAAAGLSNAADAIDDQGDEAATRTRRAAHRTANALSSGADYIRDNSARDMMDDAIDVVKSNPGVALLGAIAVGFLVGRAFSSRS
jgi:ElaB/YqjD/DUF883 family membrane-anchored ribosome-binding protein